MLTSMNFVFAAILVIMILAPLYLIYRRRVSNKTVKTRLLMQIACFFGLGVVFVAAGMNSALAATETAANALTSGMSDTGLGMIAAALATGLSGIGGGIAVAASASAALGAISENEKAFGKALIFVGLAEGVALYGLIISFMILSRI